MFSSIYAKRKTKGIEINNPTQMGLSNANLVENLVFILNFRNIASSFPLVFLLNLSSSSSKFFTSSNSVLFGKLCKVHINSCVWAKPQGGLVTSYEPASIRVPHTGCINNVLLTKTSYSSITSNNRKQVWMLCRSGTVNLKSFVGKVFFRIKWKFELN